MNPGDLLPLNPPPPKTIISVWSKILAKLIVVWQGTEIRSEQKAWLCKVARVFIRESAALSQAS